MVKMKYKEDEVSAIIAESRESCKRLQTLGVIRNTVATHRLKELRHLRAVEKLATSRRTYGFDGLEDGDDHWVHGPHPPTPEQTTARIWADLNALKDPISMSGKERSRQRLMSFVNELDQGTASLTDYELAMLKRMIVERRGRNAAHVTVAPINAAQPCSHRWRTSETSFDVRVCMVRNDEGRMNSEQGQLERSSAGTDQLESSLAGRQDEPLPPATWPWAWVRLLIFPRKNRCLGCEPMAKLQPSLQHQTPCSCWRVANLKTRRQSAKKTSNSTLVGKEGSHRLEKRVYWYIILFPEGTLGRDARCLCLVFFFLACLLCIALIR